MYAHDAGHIKIAQLLDQTFGGGSDPSREEPLSHEQSRTLLQQLSLAIMVTGIEECKALYARGCPIATSMPDCQGCSPLLYAMYDRKPEIAQWLLDNGASTMEICCKDHYGITTSAIELASADVSFVSILPNILGRYLEEEQDWLRRGEAPIHMAVKFENEEGLQILLAHVAQNIDKIG